MWNSVRAFPDALVSVATWSTGVAAASLPKRLWPKLDPYIPVTDSAPIAAILTILIAGVMGVPGFITYATEQSALNNQAILRAAQVQGSGAPSAETVSERDWGRMIVGVSGLSIFTFIFLTPVGLASTYFGISGMWRAIGAAVDDPFGDPILTGADALVRRAVSRVHSDAVRRRREALEGPPVGDRIVRGSHIGVAGAELVIVSARRKPLWDVGTAVDTGKRWFRVSSIEDRTIDGWLRTLYGFTPHRDFEAFRRRVQYEMPSHVEGRG